jgi:hypothetical protein
LDFNGTSPSSTVLSILSEDIVESPTSLPVPALQGTAAASPLRPRRPHWTPLERAGFRIAFLYFFCFLFLFGNGTLFVLFPVVGDWIVDTLNWPFRHLAVWTGQHLFNLTGVAANWHRTGSGDTTLNWILNGLFVVFALAGGLLWTAVATLRGNRRTEYRTLYAWLRFLLRLTLAMFMVIYGVGKLFPVQMAPISIAILNEPVGQSSPMTLLWSMIGLNPVYESICGAAEVLGGLLLLFRRTALLGALFSCFVLANVLLYNIFFDVPVKLFAASLLFAMMFVVLPDVRTLYRIFWLHQPAAPVGVWAPPESRQSLRITLRMVEIVYIVALILVLPTLYGIGWHRAQVAARTPSPLLGAWHLDPGHPASGAFLTGDGLPASDLYIDTVASAFTRATDGTLWRTQLDIKAAAHTVTIFPHVGTPTTYSWQLTDANHLVLTATLPEKPKAKPGAKQKARRVLQMILGDLRWLGPPTRYPKPAAPFVPAVLTLTRTPIPSHYPLLERGFHFVNQWALER